MKNLNDMLVFATVVEKGSFTAAALAYDLPKSNISRKITRLEQSLGARLLERSTRAQHLTEVGKVYYQHCLRIQEEMQSAELSVNTLMASPRGKLKICTSVAVGQGLLSPYLAGFKRLYPEVRLELNLSNRRVDLIEEGYDLTLRVGELEDSNLMAKKLCSRELYLYASPGYLTSVKMKAGDFHSPEQLANLDCLLMTSLDSKQQWQLYQGKKSCRVEIQAAFCCDDFNVLCRLAQDDAGITVLPDYIGQQAVNQGTLVRILPQWHYKKADIYALYPSHKGAMPKLRALLDYLETSFKAKEP
ncbi:LysR family transcriptional regulator [Thalassomonas sp. RHCl1]|uniref:LysR family transcriptional regulator n=1 Tax=Thalassomonas sp. RHCl1 TaxID=2995320 RepID=UPI00248BE17A|nr:LysR family transcriptional regulator [Thalassomonas sp. RHCl1]